MTHISLDYGLKSALSWLSGWLLVLSNRVWFECTLLTICQGTCGPLSERDSAGYNITFHSTSLIMLLSTMCYPGYSKTMPTTSGPAPNIDFATCSNLSTDSKTGMSLSPIINVTLFSSDTYKMLSLINLTLVRLPQQQSTVTCFKQEQALLR